MPACRLRAQEGIQKDCEFEFSLCYVVKLCIKKPEGFTATFLHAGDIFTHRLGVFSSCSHSHPLLLSECHPFFSSQLDPTLPQLSFWQLKDGDR